MFAQRNLPVGRVVVQFELPQQVIRPHKAGLSSRVLMDIAKCGQRVEKERSPVCLPVRLV